MLWSLALLPGSLLFADVVTLKDGRQISGTVESGNTQELHIKTASESQTIDIHDIQTIQFGASTPAKPAAQPPPKAADAAPAKAEPATSQPNSLILNDGTHIAGRWWSIDSTNMHFLVNNELQEYPRRDVLGVTFGNATLPSQAKPSTPAAPAPVPAEAVEPAEPARTPVPPTSSPKPAPETRSAARAPASSAGGASQAQEVGVVYSWNGTALIPLERNQAVEHGGAFEMRGPRSSVRLKEDSSLVFVVYLREGTDPAGYSLFVLETVDGNRRTRPQPGHRGALMTWPVDIKKKDGVNVITYALIVRDLPTGEYSFSPSTSNVGYCFGVDPSADGQ